MLLNLRLDVDVRNLSMVMEEMKLVDVHHTQLIKNFTIVKGTLHVAICTNQCSTWTLELNECHLTVFSQQVFLDHQGPKGTVVRLAQKDPWD